MRSAIIIVLSLFLITQSCAEEYIKKTPSAYTYVPVFNDIYLRLDGSNSSTYSSVFTRNADGYITVVAKTGGLTYTYTRDVNNYITSVTDGTGTWTPTRNVDGYVTRIDKT